MDGSGNVYVADSNNNRIRLVYSSGNVTALAGNGIGGYADGSGGPDGAAEFSNPTGVAVDTLGDVYVADTGNNRIRRIDASGSVTTLAGDGTKGFADGIGGPNGTAEFDEPSGVAVDTSGNVYVADTENNRIRRIDASGNVTTVAGSGDVGWLIGTGGPGGTAEFSQPHSVVVDASGNVDVADSSNNMIRVITSP